MDQNGLKRFPPLCRYAQINSVSNSVQKSGKRHGTMSIQCSIHPLNFNVEPQNSDIRVQIIFQTPCSGFQMVP